MNMILSSAYKILEKSIDPLKHSFVSKLIGQMWNIL